MGTPTWRRVPIVSGRTAHRALQAPEGALEVSLDLGRSRTQARVEGGALVLPDGTRVLLAELADAFSDAEDCVRLDGGVCRKVYLYSESERKYYKLFQPFEDRAPTIVINGATMHAIVAKDPWTDAAEKVACVPARAGRCLDTCCGLGYSAQLLAARLEAITTCEVDANVLEIAAVNPWSEGLFTAPNVEVRHADLRAVLAARGPGSLGCIFHDPPTVYQAGELYAEDLYRRFHAALGRAGVLYHYVGEPGKKLGQDYAGGVMRRLRSAGFGRVRRATGGVLAFKTARGRGR
jgi:predicted methyltransferase